MSTIGSPHRARVAHFVYSAAWVAGLSAVTGAAMLGRESVTAHFFGRSDQIEAFIVAALVPMFLINAAGNSVGAGFVPTLLRVRHDRGEKSASDLIAAFLLVQLGLIVAAIGICAVGFPFVLPLIARGFDETKLELCVHLFYWLLPVVAVGALGKFWLAIINGYERFAAGSLIPIVIPLTVIAFLKFAPAESRLAFLVAGVGAGFALQLVAALAAAGRFSLLRLPALARQIRPLLLNTCSQYFSLLAGTLTLMLLEVVDTTFAALQGPGTVAAVNYASKLSVLVLGFFGSALATAVVPAYARLRSSGGVADRAKFLRFAEGLTLVGGVMLAALLAWLSRDLVTLIFNRGRFGEDDVAAVSALNRLYALQAPAYLIGVVYGRLLLVEGQSRILFAGAILSVACAVAANVALAPVLGSAAIPVAATIAYLASAVWLRIRLAALMRTRGSGGSDHV